MRDRRLANDGMFSDNTLSLFAAHLENKSYSIQDCLNDQFVAPNFTFCSSGSAVYCEFECRRTKADWLGSGLRTDRLNLSGTGPLRVKWISETEWVERTGAEWSVVDASSGAKREWFSKELLVTSLITEGLLSREDAQKLVEGDWKFVSHNQGVVIFEHQNNWIRIHIDGTRKAIVKDLPDQRELEELSPTGHAVAFVRNFDLWGGRFRIRKLPATHLWRFIDTAQRKSRLGLL